MLRFSLQTRADQSSDTQNSGLLHHPTQEIIIAYRFVSAAPGVSQTFLTYCQEQLDHELVHSTLEFHQLLDQWTQTAQRMNVECALVGVGQIDERMVLAAYNGAIVLKRGSKVGQILHAEDSLAIVEGKVHQDDVYVLLTQQAERVQEVLQPQLAKVSAGEAGGLLDETEVSSVVSEFFEQSGGVVVVAALQEAQENHQDEASAPSLLPMHEQTMRDTEPAQPRMSAADAAQKATAALHSAKKVGGQAAEALTNISNSIKVEFSQLWSNDVYVRRRKRKSLGYIGIFAVVLIFSAIGTYAFLRNRQTQQQQEVTQVLTPYRARRAEIEGLVSENPVAARQSTEELIAELDILAKKNDQPKYLATALAAELDSTQQFYTSISGQEEFPVLPTFFDLRLVQSNFLASAIDITPDTLFFLDGGQRKILALNIEKKQPTILPIGEYPDLHAMVADEKYLYFLSQGLFRFTLSGTEVAKIVENPDETITTGNSLGVFGSYVYVMNKSRNNIFRYTTNDEQLSSTPSAWVQASEGMDFSTVQNFSIDGDIWLGTQQGEIKKFSSGRQAEFTVTGLKEPFNSPVTVFTKPDLENLYVLESQQSRMVVLNKNGEFLKEVKSSTLAASTSVVASEQLQKVFALSGSLVFEIGL